MELLKKIAESKRKLGIVSRNLKTKFVGLDDIIDSVIDNISVWHAMPEVIERPVIINLWGMTGVGKTDLIRSLARELDMMSTFIEIQLRNSTQIDDSIERVLSRSALNIDQPGILLLDEVQRFRSVDGDGKDVTDNGFHDLWMLLSDGRFAGAKNQHELHEWMFGSLYYDQYAMIEKTLRDQSEEEKQEEDVERKIQARMTYRQPYHDARRIKTLFRLTEPIEEIMKWSDARKTEVLNARASDPAVYEGVSYKRLLIFISGNLDEAYGMAGETGEADVDADVFHAFSKKITLIDIKKVLRERFKPEQIARLGNTHIIYPSLSHASYVEIINRHVNSIVERVKEFGIEIEVDQSVKNCIYRNGVFPTQGVRPVFSTINAMLGNTIPLFVMKAVEAGKSNITISADGDYLVSIIAGKEIKQKVERRVDVIRRDIDGDKKCLVSVHESGHALVFCLLFDTAPLQVVGNAATANPAGWIGVPQLGRSKQQLLDNICVVMAGLCAEEMVFGDTRRCDGCRDDIAYATSVAAAMHRDSAMGISISKRESEAGGHAFNYDVDVTNPEIEKTVKEQKDRAARLISDNKKLLVVLARELQNSEQMSSEDFQKFMKKNGKNIRLIPASATIYEKYRDMFSKFSKKVV